MGLFAPANPEQRQENDLKDILAEQKITNKLLADLIELTKQQMAASGANPAQSSGPFGAIRV